MEEILAITSLIYSALYNPDSQTDLSASKRATFGRRLRKMIG